MKKIILFFVAVALLSTVFSQTSIRTGCHKIRIIYETKNINPIPGHWRSDEVKAYHSPLPDSLVQKNIDILSEELHKYPRKLLKKINKVFLFDSLAFFDKAFGGTYYRKNIYYTDRGFTAREIAAKIHHEFSSILLENKWNKFDLDAWHELLPEGFQYRSKGVDALMTSDANLNLNDSLFLSGFLNTYSMYNIEEDINSFAQYMWNGDTAFWQAYDQFPLIRQKANILIGFYHDLSKEISLEYLQGLK